MTFPAPPLEGFVAIVQHKPDIARRLESALAHAGATVFIASRARETVELRKKYDAQLMANVGAIRYSAEVSRLPELMTFATWVDISRPVADVVEAAIRWRGLLGS